VSPGSIGEKPFLAARWIVVVDDDPSVRLMFKLMFETAGYRVSEARNGVAALILIRDSLPDLVVTDMVMPEMGGRELIARIRFDPRTASVLILAVTGHPGAKEEAIGADAVLDKPFDRPLLLKTVTDLVDQRNFGSQITEV
jgi:CheY-like chemotaxis protein